MSFVDVEKEYIKCANDPLYYLNNYGYVFDAKKQKVTPMTCFDYQEDCIDLYHDNQNSIILKSRQCLPKGTLVDTPTGSKTIDKLETGDEVLSYNLLTNEVEKDIVSESWNSGKNKCASVYLKDGRIVEVGENHPFYIQEKGWVSAKKIKKGNKILDKNRGYIEVKCVKRTITKETYDISVENNENYFIDGLLVHNTGLSVITAGYCAWRLIFRIDQKILIIANDGDGAERFLGAVKQFVSYTPKWMLPGDGVPITNNLKRIELKNGSWAKARASSENAGRGESLTLLVLDEAAFIDHINKIWMGAGMALSATQGKCIWLSCVPKDTFVFTNNGVKEVGDFVNPLKSGGYSIGDYKVLGKNNLREGNLFFNNGVQPTKKISTTSSCVEGTFNHKLWACKNGVYSWYEMKNIELGDYIAIQHGDEIWGSNDDVSDFAPSESGYILNKFNPKKITKEIAYLIGLYIAEGSVYKTKNKNDDFIGGSVTLTCGDDISKAIKDIELSYSSWDSLHYGIGSKNLIEFLEYLGFDLSKKAKEKTIPSRLFNISRENIIYMLRGIFDGDGYSRKDKGYIGIGMNSKRLIEQIRILLLNFGVLTDYYEVWTKPTKKVKVSTLNFRISSNARYSKIFYDKIGFNFERKQLNENVLIKYNLERNNPNDVIPFSVDLLNKLVKESGFSRYKLRKKGIRISDKKTGHISRGLLFKVFDFCKDKISEDTKKIFLERVDEKIKWEKVQKIKYDEKETFDFSLPNNEEDFWAHSVVYNGVLGHQTPNGTGGLYHKTWIDAEDAQNDFIPKTVHWTENPHCAEGLEERKDLDGEKIYWSPWYEKECRRLNDDPVLIAQELDLSFEGSKRLAIESDLISKYEKRLLTDEYKKIIAEKRYYDYRQQPGQRFVQYETPFHVFKAPKPGHKYIIGGDVARGDGKDYSTLHVIDIDELEVVAEYRAKISPDLFAEAIYAIGKDYNYAYLAIEANSFGLATTFDLNRKMKYERMHFSKSVKDLHVRPYNYKVDVHEAIPGFQTNKKTRPLVVNTIRVYMREGQLKIYSKRFLSELRSFVQNGDRSEAEKGYNDDLVLALGIGLYIRDTDFQNATMTQDMYRSMLDAIGVSGSDTKGKSYTTSDNVSKKDIAAVDGAGIYFGNNINNESTIVDDKGNDVSWLITTKVKPKPHYFNDNVASPDDRLLKMAKQQGYVPETCLLGGEVVMSIVNKSTDPCKGCLCSRNKCGGRL